MPSTTKARKRPEEKMRDAEDTIKHDSGMAVGNVLGNTEGVVSTVSSMIMAGKVNVWDVETGEHSFCNENMLKSQLKKTRKNPKTGEAEYVFTTVDPGIKPKRGHYLCMLHPASENRTVADELSLPECRKENLTNPMQVKTHMKHRHKDEWAALEEYRTSKERSEDRQFQRDTMELVSRQGG